MIQIKLTAEQERNLSELVDAWFAGMIVVDEFLEHKVKGIFADYEKIIWDRGILICTDDSEENIISSMFTTVSKFADEGGLQHDYFFSASSDSCHVLIVAGVEPDEYYKQAVEHYRLFVKKYRYLLSQEDMKDEDVASFIQRFSKTTTVELTEEEVEAISGVVTRLRAYNPSQQELGTLGEVVVKLRKSSNS